jgi:hypothetical protein
VTKEEKEARSAAAALLGSKGGKARAKALTKKQRHDIAQKAAETRWQQAPNPRHNKEK